LAPYQKYQNIIVIANGGSRTSSLAFVVALSEFCNKKKIEFLSTLDPAVIYNLKKKYSSSNTLIMPISKSGTNVDVLEPLFHFTKYRTLPVTSPNKGVLYEMAKVQGWDIIEHPEVGGRYSARTNCGFAPSSLMGLDVNALNKSMLKAYKSLGYEAKASGNIALKAASTCYQLERKGYNQIFMPVYSRSLSGFLPLIIQLIHESTGKIKKGQTIFGDEAPESQHHTNQRFFGGPKNVIGWFLTLKNPEPKLVTKVPKKLENLALRNGKLKDISNIPLADALRFDYEGVAQHATRLKIPNITLEIDSISYSSIGELMSFFHFYTVYSALLRNQDPFNQPEVEAAKDSSFKKRVIFSK
jgi:glucose-6-phosphate isomerase